jgi:hypothetical protein
LTRGPRLTTLEDAHIGDLAVARPKPVDAPVMYQVF